MKSAPIQTPLRAQDCYVRTQDELDTFEDELHETPEFLTLDQILDVFPNGQLTHYKFQRKGLPYKLISKINPLGTGILYLAVLDEGSIPSSGPGMPATLSPSSSIIPRTSSAKSSPHWMNPREHAQASSSADVNDLTERNRFMDDIIIANNGAVPLDRYKALIRLMSLLRRHYDAAHIPLPDNPRSWTSMEAQLLLKHIMLVGDCLAKFGTTDFNERSNTSRAITAKDYATLLKQYISNHGVIFDDKFIEGMGQQLQDEALAVRNLLKTRCEANDLLFHQLVRHVGLENQSGGGAVVYNSSVITANPTNQVTSNPSNVVHSTSQAKAKLSQSSGIMGVVAALAAVGLMLLKGRLGGGGGGRHKDRARGPERPGRQEHNATERIAVRTLALCQQEIKKSMNNSELLVNDWRLGRLRLASPLNPFPPGYQSVEPSACDLDQFYQRLEYGGLPPYRGT